MAIDPVTYASEYDDDRAGHERDVLAELRAAGFTETQQAQFLEAWDANDGTLTPDRRPLLDRHWDYINRDGA